MPSGHRYAWAIAAVADSWHSCVGAVRLATDPGGSQRAGRAYAAYGGVYIVASLIWLWAIEGVRPDRWDGIGATICLIGAFVIILGPRASWRKLFDVWK